MTTIKINRSGKGLHNKVFNKAIHVYGFKEKDNYKLIWLGSHVKKGGIQEEADYELFDDESYKKG